MANSICEICRQKGCGLVNNPLDAEALYDGVTREPESKDGCIGHMCPGAADSAAFVHTLATETAESFPVTRPFATIEKGVFANHLAESRRITINPGGAGDGEVFFVLGNRKVVVYQLLPYITQLKSSRDRFKRLKN